MTNTKRIDSDLPAATLAQRLAALSETGLMLVARELATRPEADALCTAVLEALEARVSGRASRRSLPRSTRRRQHERDAR